MGCSQSAEQKKDRALTKILKQEGLNKPKKLLLLGAGRAGKSTIFKQIRRIYDHGFTENERKQYVAPVRANVLMAGRYVASQLSKQNHSIDPVFLNTILNTTDTSPITPSMAHVLAQLTANNSEFRRVLQESLQEIGESAIYFLERVELIASDRYIPSEEDLVRVRVRTSGIVEMPFTMRGVPFVITDVGGQRGERRKWIHCFDNVDAVLFVAAISEYDQTLAEDQTKNALEESLDIFRSIVNHKQFAQTAIILFLNKSDVFKEKLNRRQGNLADLFEGYDAGYDYDKAIEYLIDEFLECREDEEHNVYYHVTCATDKNNVEFVFRAVEDIVLNLNLQVNNLI